MPDRKPAWENLRSVLGLIRIISIIFTLPINKCHTQTESKPIERSAIWSAREGEREETTTESYKAAWERDLDLFFPFSPTRVRPRRAHRSIDDSRASLRMSSPWGVGGGRRDGWSRRAWGSNEGFGVNREATQMRETDGKGGPFVAVRRVPQGPPRGSGCRSSPGMRLLVSSKYFAKSNCCSIDKTSRC